MENDPGMTSGTTPLVNVSSPEGNAGGGNWQMEQRQPCMLEVARAILPVNGALSCGQDCPRHLGAAQLSGSTR